MNSNTVATLECAAHVNAAAIMMQRTGSFDAVSGKTDGIGSSCEVNWLIDGRCGEGLPAVDLAHVDLAASKQRPEQHGGCIGGGSTVCVLILRLNSSCSRSIAFVV